MTITALPTPPSPSDSPAAFNSKAFDLLGALPTFVTEANALEAENAAAASAAASAVLADKLNTANPSYTGTLTGGTGIVNLGSGQFVIDASGDLTTANGRINLITVGRGGGGVASNTASGYAALHANTTGVNNTASGYAALYSNTTGVNNTASGVNALHYNTTGYSNTASGVSALYANTTGYSNTASGRSGYNPDNDIAQYRITTDFDMTLVGYGATKDNVGQLWNSTAIGARAKVTKSNQVVLGDSNVTETLINGNLGLGITSPASTLHIQDATLNNGTLQLGGTTYYGTVKHDASITGANIYNVASASGGGHIFQRGGTTQFMTDSSGNLTLSAGAMGYGTGAGGTVTQVTSKATAVTLNKPSGTVTMHNASLAAGASVLFALNNTFFATTDTVVLTATAWSIFYRVETANSATGQIGIRVTNTESVSRSDPLVFSFTIIKGATA